MGQNSFRNCHLPLGKNYSEFYMKKMSIFKEVTFNDSQRDLNYFDCDNKMFNYTHREAQD